MRIDFILFTSFISSCFAGISPVHDFQAKLQSKNADDVFSTLSPYRVLKHLDGTLNKATQNVTNNHKMDETLFQISKTLVSSILSVLEIQEKITRITREALDASGKNKRITAIETRRILDYISRTLSNNILLATKESTEYELHHLVYGLAQIATETSIVSALKDTTFATVLSKKQTIDLSLRKKRSVKKESLEKLLPNLSHPTQKSIIYNVILNKTDKVDPTKNYTGVHTSNDIIIPESPYSVIQKDQRKIIQVVEKESINPVIGKVFLNKTALDLENSQTPKVNNTTAILLDKTVNTNNLKSEIATLDLIEPNAPVLIDDWNYGQDNSHKEISSDVVAEMEMDQEELGEEVRNEKKAKQKLDRLESKAKKAILYAGDVAFLAAASVVAMRRALTASTEVQMSVMLAKNGMSNHQDLMMNLAKSAAQQVGKEAKIATSKSLACERMLKLAVKYTAQSNGAILNHVANRIVMSTLSLSTLAKSMAFVSSDIAINSLYIATDVKPPS